MINTRKPLTSILAATVMLLACLAPLSCEKDNVPPDVSIDTPSDGDTVFGSQTITVTASDDDSLVNVSILIDDEEVAADSESPLEYEWNTLEYDDGTKHTIKATALDPSDNQGETEITVTVDQPSNPPDNPSDPPSGPGAGLINETLAFSASATDPDGDSISIQFDWGDGTKSDWSEYVASGETVTLEKSFSDTGTFEVKFKAKDTYEVPTNWSPPLEVLISETPSYGSIQVNSTPSGADIMLSDTATGKQTNHLFSGLLPGNYKISLRLLGHKDFDTTVAVKAEETTTLDVTLEEIGTLVWSYETGGEVNSSVAIGPDGTLFFGSGDKNLYALNPSGVKNWSYETDVLEVSSSPAVGPDSMVYFGSQEEYLYALRPDGSLRWRYKADGAIRYSPALDEDVNVYFGTTDHYLYVIDSSGDRITRYETGDDIRTSPAIGPDGTIYFGCDDGKIYAMTLDVQAEELTVKWDYETGNWAESSPAIGSDGTIYCGSHSDYIYALDASDGSLMWEYKTGGDIHCSPVIGSDGTIYVGSDDYYLYALNPDGTLQWKYETGNRIRAHPVVGEDGSVYIGSYDGKLYALRPDGTLKWTFETEGLIETGPVID
ncbi:PQQ-binding-like beta-propeller repeat protein, partial [candidate division WOR-3 bacterium]|nr:PQQ-binding-like beta-propeller repeat protein [candidate division WOR-3 bacterium]MBD3365088.1 PQQ-binding-like beta-propeller repeat protein [candidate division WOR-3 bacterium]